MGKIPWQSVSHAFYKGFLGRKQQKEIIQNVEKSDNVIVQFEDKTVEAETVANIVSHYLTEGKKILITTQKDSPLATLKDQIPDDIKDLCVSIVDEDLDGNVEIEKAISVIADRLENLNVQALKEKIRSNQLLLIQSNENEKLYNEILKKYAKSEGTPIKYKKQSLFCRQKHSREKDSGDWKQVGKH